MEADNQVPEVQPQLQFETAEYAAAQAESAGGSVCAICGAAITVSYWELGGKLACESCCERVRAHLSGGSGLLRLVRAVIFGIIAAALGSAIWAGVRIVTGYELGIIALLVGLLVGGAVQAGSRRRGGWPYQLLAIFLTYSAIVANYVPTVIRGWSEKPAATQPGARAAADASATAPAEAEEAAEPVAAERGFPQWSELSVLGKALMVVFSFGVLFVLLVPTLISGGELIGFLIVGFALYEAWKMNRRRKVAISGPFQVAGAPAAVAAAGAVPECGALPEAPGEDFSQTDAGETGRD